MRFFSSYAGRAEREYTIMAKTHTYPFTCMKCREMRHCMKLALYLKSSIQDRTNTVGQKDRSLAAGISISQYFSKLSWLGTQPARQGPWNLSRKKSQLTLWKGFPHLCCRIDSLLRSLEKNIDFFFFFLQYQTNVSGTQSISLMDTMRCFEYVPPKPAWSTDSLGANRSYPALFWSAVGSQDRHNWFWQVNGNETGSENLHAYTTCNFDLTQPLHREKI